MIHNVANHFANEIGWPDTILAIALLVIALVFGVIDWLHYELRLAERVLRRSL